MGAGLTPRAAETATMPNRNAEMVDFLDQPPPQPLARSTKRGFSGASRRQAATQSGWKGRYGPGKPAPWFQLKFMIFVMLALFAWSFYVMVGRICAPMIQDRSPTELRVAAGVGIMVGFIILWLTCAWCYLKVILTSPGFAKEHVPKAAPPSNQFSGPSREYIPYIPPTSQALTSDRSGIAIGARREPFSSSATNSQISAGPDPSEFAAISNVVGDFVNRSASNHPSSSTTLAGNPPTSKSNAKAVKDWREVQRPLPQIERGPRWCRFCEINKPDRTHHCRHCGTCVMQFDHHCIWLGQCVGWANHKFFITFNFWGTLFNAYLCGIGILFLCKSPAIDGQVIGLTAASGFLLIFVALMLPTHIHLILAGKSTVESFKGRDQREAEIAELQKEYGILWHNQEKRKVRRRWKEEWGGLLVDERWKFGTRKQLWEQEMGDAWLGWILPIGRPRGDGIHFSQNPRFGPNGEWLQKKDWPRELQSW